MQEKEADIFGIRLACQAGYDPQGMLSLMRFFAQLQSSAGSFMNNHPAAIERYNYLQVEAARCTSFQTRQQGPATQEPPVVASLDAAVSAPSPTAEPSGESMWKLIQDPNSRWTFKIGSEFLYGEHAYIEERRRLGDFDTVDVKKQEDNYAGTQYAGTQRVRRTFKIKNASPEGFRYKSCHWNFAVELTVVTEDRIEGRWESYPPGSQVNPLTCERSGARIWEDVAWVRE